MSCKQASWESKTKIWLSGACFLLPTLMHRSDNNDSWLGIGSVCSIIHIVSAGSVVSWIDPFYVHCSELSHCMSSAHCMMHHSWCTTGNADCIMHDGRCRMHHDSWMMYHSTPCTMRDVPHLPKTSYKTFAYELLQLRRSTRKRYIFARVRTTVECLAAQRQIVSHFSNKPWPKQI